MSQLGKLSPLYRFILNPYNDVRFSTCPECSQRTLLRKVPLVIHVDPRHPMLLNKRCRYCPNCDVLIAHQDELEEWLAITFEKNAPEIIGNDYLVLGTVDKTTWHKQKKEPIPMGELPEYLHDFKEYLKLSYSPAGWYPKDHIPTPREEPPPSKPTARTTLKSQESPPVFTIDDYQQVELLLAKIESQLPIPAEIQRGPANYLRSQGLFIPPHRNVQIQSVFYAGDEGGIMCAISPKDSKEPVVISLTYLKIPYRHLLEKEIRAYQKIRAGKLKESNY
jgi:hypothetical protein